MEPRLCLMGLVYSNGELWDRPAHGHLREGEGLFWIILGAAFAERAAPCVGPDGLIAFSLTSLNIALHNAEQAWDIDNPPALAELLSDLDGRLSCLDEPLPPDPALLARLYMMRAWQIYVEGGAADPRAAAIEGLLGMSLQHDASAQFPATYGPGHAMRQRLEGARVSRCEPERLTTPLSRDQRLVLEGGAREWRCAGLPVLAQVFEREGGTERVVWTGYIPGDAPAASWCRAWPVSAPLCPSAPRAP